MKVVVPLTGPDLVHPVLGLKPLYALRGEPLLRRALDTRPWRVSGEATESDLIFVLREGQDLAPLRDFIASAYPAARVLTLTHPTGGALFSCIVGATAFAGETEPLCLDLADTPYDWPGYDAKALWAGTAAAAPAFESRDPAFSYLRLEHGQVVEVGEKRAASTSASAGTYLFSDLGTLLGASAEILAQMKRWTGPAEHFLCPILNGVIARRRHVVAPGVVNAEPVSALFRDARPDAA